METNNGTIENFLKQVAEGTLNHSITALENVQTFVIINKKKVGEILSSALRKKTARIQ